MKYADASQLVSHPVTCLDCHDPKTMKLRITRPAFLEGIANLAKSADPVTHMPSIEQWRTGPRTTDYDPNALASRQELRSMSCAQCHVEYYFKGDQKRLTFPWHNGLKVEQMEKYYDDVQWKDWTHTNSGAPVLKAQHPEFELWSQGIHARSGVSCADCHMPYKREGGMKISDHHVRSPLLNINRACQGCHHFSEQEMKDRAEEIQNRFKVARDLAMDALVEYINDIKKARESGAADSQLKAVWEYQRQAQFYIDFVEADNSGGFHAPGEELKTLAEAIDLIRKGQKALKEIPLQKAAAPAKTPKQGD